MSQELIYIYKYVHNLINHFWQPIVQDTCIQEARECPFSGCHIKAD